MHVTLTFILSNAGKQQSRPAKSYGFRTASHPAGRAAVPPGRSAHDLSAKQEITLLNDKKRQFGKKNYPSHIK